MRINKGLYQSCTTQLRIANPATNELAHNYSLSKNLTSKS